MKISGFISPKLSARWLVIPAALLSFSACAMPSDKQPTSKSRPDATQTTSGTTVEIVDFKFTPEVQTIARGTTVSWVNRDPYFHTVTSGQTDGPVNEPDGAFDRDLKETGDVAKVRFDKPGTYSYFCKQHNAMNGEIQVS